MKCLSCDCILTDFEATRKSELTKEYLDLCNMCFETIDIEEVGERYDLEGKGEYYNVQKEE